MARGFGTTYGTSGTTDRVNTAYAGNNSGGTRSYWFRYFLNGAGGGTFGRVFQKGGATNTGSEVLFYSSSTVFVFSRYNSSGTRTAEHSIAHGGTGAWRTMLIVHDESSGIKTAPTVWRDNVSVTPTSITGTSAGINPEGSSYVVGNRSGNDRAWDGMIAEWAVWNADVSAYVDQLHDGCAPNELPILPVSYLPLVREPIDVVGAVGTVTGALAQAHPSVRRRRLFHFPVLYPAVVGGSFKAAWAHRASGLISAGVR